MCYAISFNLKKPSYIVIHIECIKPLPDNRLWQIHSCCTYYISQMRVGCSLSIKALFFSINWPSGEIEKTAHQIKNNFFPCLTDHIVFKQLHLSSLCVSHNIMCLTSAVRDDRISKLLGSEPWRIISLNFVLYGFCIVMVCTTIRGSCSCSNNNHVLL